MGVSQIPQEQQPATETNGDLEVPGESTVLKRTELLTRWLHVSPQHLGQRIPANCELTQGLEGDNA